MSEFEKMVTRAVKSIPYGMVASYGQIALMVGLPGGARAVGQTLKKLEIDDTKSLFNIPWWRVVNNAGRVSIKGNKFHNAKTQRDLLIEEGVVVEEDLTLDIRQYRFLPTHKDMNDNLLPKEYLDLLYSKFFV